MERRRRRHINVEDIDVQLIELDLDGTAPSAKAVLTDEIVARD